MQVEAKKYLYEIPQTAELIRSFTVDKTMTDSEGDALLSLAGERQLEIIGEAPVQLARLDQALTARITDYRRVIAFRNILIHGYAGIDPKIIWNIVESKLPTLFREVSALLEEK